MHFSIFFTRQMIFQTQSLSGVSINKGHTVSHFIFTLLFIVAQFFLHKDFLEKYFSLWFKSYYSQINLQHITIVDSFRIIVQSLYLLLFKLEVKPTQWNIVKDIKRSGVIYGLLLDTLYLPIKKGVTLIDKLAQKQPLNAQGKKEKIINRVLMLALVVLSIFCLTIPFEESAQIIFVGILLLVVLVLKRIPGRLTNMLMIIFSLIASTRYIWWRYNSTINFDQPLDLTFSLLLLFAESYAWVVIVLGYVQNIWPLDRKPVDLPKDSNTWPTIDLFIPTYNESLEVVRPTVLAALGVDWPEDKLNIYILDDGKRDEFSDFAKQMNVGYFRRPTNEYAKAGNINYALGKTNSDYVAIFDCDHIPTRAFFQVTMGAFLIDHKLALMQTPHHFFSPDPFEKNLGNFRNIPNEGNLFYGLVQDGNDTWDATFFCGSCAVLKRKPLMEVGGIAIETVTEDAHTALKMHRLGYHSAYLKQPISAGLATESLSAHIGQRIRWARGMVQIFRVDNPLFGKGLKWNQKICYLNAMLHFLSGIPRLIFLVAPLAFLFFNIHIIYASASALLLYVFPHMVHANITNSRLQGEYRHSFWGEVYETVLAWYIAIPTTIALFAPSKGTFNVTSKGGLIDKQYYDWFISRPYIVLMLLNLVGFAFGISKLWGAQGQELSSLFINLFWCSYNLLIIGGALAVAAEEKQIRNSHRIPVHQPSVISLASGHVYPVDIIDFSLTGMRVSLPEGAEAIHGSIIHIQLYRADIAHTFKGEVRYVNKRVLGIFLLLESTEKEIAYVQCTFARADLWAKWQQEYEQDDSMSSLKSILLVGLIGYNRLLKFSPKWLQQYFKVLLSLLRFIASFRPKFVLSKGTL